MSFPPTEEQNCILYAYKDKKDVVVVAGAGAGKTSALQLLAFHTDPSTPALYLAFNKNIEMEAKSKFYGMPVVTSTVHALAHTAIIKSSPYRAQYQERLGKGKYLRADDYAKVIGLNGGESMELTKFITVRKRGKTESVKKKMLSKRLIIASVRKVLERFMKSDATTVEGIEVTLPEPFESLGQPAQVERIKSRISALAAIAWEQTQAPDGGLPFSHDVYLKMWALTNPVIPYQIIFYDEAQDADPVMLGILHAQKGKQMVVVGDENQAIYGWRGAKDSMREFGGERLSLTKSFRFGQPIAEVANWWLNGLEADLRITGFEQVHSVVKPIWDHSEDAVLCRTNSGAILEVINAHRRGITVAIASAGQAKQMRDLADACRTLKEKGYTYHPDLEGFDSWQSVQDFVMEEDVQDLATLVKLVETYGEVELLNAIDACVPVDEAQLTVSTAHVAKGLEWPRVRIADDFRPPKPLEDGTQPPISREEAMLAYVAVTRAQNRLDMSGLAWALHYGPGIAKREVEEKPAETAEEAVEAAFKSAVKREQASALASVGGF